MLYVFYSKNSKVKVRPRVFSPSITYAANQCAMLYISVRKCYYSHFMEEDTEAQLGNGRNGIQT